VGARAASPTKKALCKLLKTDFHGALLMSDQPERCKIKIVPHPVKGVELELKGNCFDTIKIIESLPPRRSRYFMRRIKVVD
jgi:hypothetical protein